MDNIWRQKLHLEPPVGWMNDPNGLSWFCNKYQVYFQYAPDDINGGVKKCWGHYESPDMIHWNFTGTVLVPDIPEDKSGVYSGSALEYNGDLNIFYTGNVKHKGDYDYIYNGREANVIRVTTKDGHNMTPKQVLMRNEDYPSFCSCHVRDPKVWHKDGKFYMILGARTLESSGCVLIYESDDLEKWRYCNCLTVPDFGYMWECPDVIYIDGRTYVSVSPQGLPHGEVEHQNMFSSGYFRYEDELKDFTEWDYGFDFYAPQTFDAPDGRKILIAWMGMGDAYENPTVEFGYQQCLTIPRVLTLSDDGYILQQPIQELEKLREDRRIITSGAEETVMLPFDMYSRTPENFSMKIDTLNMKRENGIFSIEFDEGSGYGREIRRVRTEECRDIRIIADTSSIEIYLDRGRYVMSTRFYPSDQNVKIKCDGIDAELYNLKGMEMKISGK